VRPAARRRGRRRRLILETAKWEAPVRQRGAINCAAATAGPVGPARTKNHHLEGRAPAPIGIPALNREPRGVDIAESCGQAKDRF